MILLGAGVIGFLLLPQHVDAGNGEVAGWIPYWAAEAGTNSAIKHMRKLDTVHPFVFEVTADGQLINRVDFEADHWQRLFAKAREHRVEIIPTIAWFDGQEIDFVLKNDTLRKRHVQQIEKMVDEYDFDGVDIDYEGKLSDTIDDFSQFLKELQKALDRRQALVCTLEARTPPESLYIEVPDTIEYANDYEEIAKHCDRIQIMAYDQQRADVELNNKRRGVPYIPVADVDWVEKVIRLALEDFDEDTVMLGVPTYGRAWDVTVASEWYRDYTQIATLNQPRILELATKYDAPIGRTAGGEAVISYFPEDSVWKIFNQLPTPKGTPRGFEAAAKALLVATVADIEVPVRVVIWSDGEAIGDKIELVEKYDLRGTSFFKLDDEEDTHIWKLL